VTKLSGGESKGKGVDRAKNAFLFRGVETASVGVQNVLEHIGEQIMQRIEWKQIRAAIKRLARPGLMGSTAMAVVWAGVALLAAGVLACQATHTASGERKGWQRVYPVAEAEAFAAARQALAEVIPDGEIEEASKPARRYRIRGYRTADSGEYDRSIFEVYLLRFEGMTEEGAQAEGYTVRVSSTSLGVRRQDRTMSEIFSAFEKHLSSTHSGVLITREERLPYETSELSYEATGPDARPLPSLPPEAASKAQLQLPPQLESASPSAVLPEPSGRTSPPESSDRISPAEPIDRMFCVVVRRDGVALALRKPLAGIELVRLRLADGSTPNAHVDTTVDDPNYVLLKADARTPDFLLLESDHRRSDSQRTFAFGWGESVRDDSALETIDVEPLLDSSRDDMLSLHFESAARPAAGAPLVDEAGYLLGLILPSEAGKQTQAPLASGMTSFVQRPLAARPSRSREDAIERARASLCEVFSARR
jgi:hypothetical protein